MKLIIDIPEEDRKDIGNIHFVREDLKFKIGKAIMNGIPLADVRENIHGEWTFIDKCSNSGYYCSICHKKIVKEGWSDTVKKINFCPNCGADMRGET